MPKSIITKRVGLTRVQWAWLNEQAERCGYTILAKALDNAELISETVNPAEELNEIDAWVIDAVNEGRDVR